MSPRAPEPAELPDREWMRHAACLNTGPEDGPGAGLPWTTDTIELPVVIGELMAATCAACPVRLACAAYADQAGITGGFWAGHDRSLDQRTNRPPRRADRSGNRNVGEQIALPLFASDVDGAA